MVKIPAFIDSHLHMLGIGYYQEILDLAKYNSVKEIKEAVRENQFQTVIIGRGWNQENLLEKRVITKNDLDDLLTPTVLFRICGHVATVNQAMFDMMKIDSNNYQVAGGTYDYETGIFTEKALGLIYNYLPKPTKKDIRRYLIRANQILLENGITRVASDDFSSFNVPYEDIIKVINEVDEEGLLDVEITEQVNLPIELLKDFLAKGYANKRYNNFKLGPLKILADGSLGGRTASLNQPYSDESDNYGILTYSDSELRDLVDLANRYKMDSVIHAIGDRTIDQAIKIISESDKKYPRSNTNHAIIHNQIATHQQIELMKANNIGAIVQPIFINTDIKIVKERLGNRTNESYLFKSMYKNISTGFSTDSPVEPVNPFYNIYCAITRKSIDFPDYLPLNISEAFTINEALDAYTTNNLRYVYEDELKDYIEVDQDLFSIDLEKIKEVKVLKAYKNKKLVYQRKN
jgi:predicted amidohydrolase YtcJ